MYNSIYTDLGDSTEWVLLTDNELSPCNLATKLKPTVLNALIRYYGTFFAQNRLDVSVV